MSMEDKKVISIRRERNSDLLRRMNNGESLTSYDSSASWFPPRPTIQKDSKIMSKLYKKPVEKIESKKKVEKTEESEEGNIVALPLAQ